MKIIKKTLLVVTTISGVHANTPISQTTSSTSTAFISGFYAGAELGYVHEGHEYKEKRSGVNNVDPNTNAPFSFKFRKKCNSFLPGLFAGYRHSLGPVFLGFEFSANLNESKSKGNFVDRLDIKATESIKPKYNIIPTILLGMPIPRTDTLNIYGKIGYDLGKYCHHLSELRGNGTIYNKESKTSTIGRFHIAFGTEHSITKLLSTRFEIAHSVGKTIKIKMAGKLSADNTYCSTTKIATTSVKIGVFAKL